MSQETDPCSECSRPKHQFRSSKIGHYINKAVNFSNPPILIDVGEVSDTIYKLTRTKEICANPGCSEGQNLLEDKLRRINKGLGNGWDQVKKNDIELLEQFSEGTLDLVDENGINWQDKERIEDWSDIEDTIDEFDEAFTAQATKDMSLWGIENAPNPGIERIPSIGNALVNLHETRAEIKRGMIEKRMDEIERYGKLDQTEEASYHETIISGIEQNKGDFEDLNEIREKIGRYRDQQEFQPLRDLQKSEVSENWTEQSEKIGTEQDLLQRLQQIDEGRRSNVDTAWYDEQNEERTTLVEDQELSMLDLGKSEDADEDMDEESEPAEKEENEQEQSDELQQVKQEKQRLEKSLQQERDEKQRLRGENEELRDKNQDLQDDLQAVRDEHTTLQEKIQTSSEEHQQQGIETNTTDPQNDSSDRSTNSPVATATAKLRGGLAKSTGAVRKVGAKLRGRLSRTPDKPYPAQHATNIHTTAADTNTSSTQTRDEQQERSATNDRTTNRATEQNRTNGHERTNRRDSKRNEPDRGLF